METQRLIINQRARQLRNDPTKAEYLLWQHLRKRQILGHKFRRQQPIGNYIVDFVCLERYLIIELDGGQHAQQLKYDAARTTFLENRGFQVLRFWNDQVFNELPSVKEEIAKWLEKPPTPSPPPARRGTKV